MKANEFVKKFGWDLAKQYLNRTKNQGVYIEPKIKLMVHQSICEPTTSGIDFVFHRNDLKLIVESHDYIESLGGYQFVKDNLQFGYFGDGDYKNLIQKCLEDFESCK